VALWSRVSRARCSDLPGCAASGDRARQYRSSSFTTTGWDRAARRRRTGTASRARGHEPAAGRYDATHDSLRRPWGDAGLSGGAGERHASDGGAVQSSGGVLGSGARGATGGFVERLVHGVNQSRSTAGASGGVRRLVDFTA
jgi:hypothetical protein